MATMGRITSSSPKLAGSGEPVRATPCGAISTFNCLYQSLGFVRGGLSVSVPSPTGIYRRAIGASIVVRDLALDFPGLIGLAGQSRWQKQCPWLTPFILAFRGFH